MKQKVLIFHPALAPYRVDQFNNLGKLFDLEVVFIFENVWNHNFDQTKLRNQLKFKYTYLLKGPSLKGRVFRFGIYNKIKKSKPNIVIGYEYSFTTLYLIFLKRIGLLDSKVGSTIDDSLEICNNVQTKFRYAARRYSVKYLNFLVVLSKEVSLYYEREFQFLSNEIIISPILQNPLRLRSHPKNLEVLAAKYQKEYKLDNKKVLLFVGRFIPEKNLVQFIANIKAVLNKQDDLVIVLVGNGVDKNNIETFIKNNKLENKIILPGRYEGLELYAWYLCASGFFLPSKYEPFGAVVNEALIFGLKVLCSKYAGSSFLIESNKGLIFDPLDSINTNKKLEEFLLSVNIITSQNINLKESLLDYSDKNFQEEWRKIKRLK